MQELTFTIPFNRDNFLRNQKLKWRLFVKKRYEKLFVLYIIVDVVLLAFTVSLFTVKSNADNDSVFMAFLVLCFIASPWITILRSKKAFFKAADQIADRCVPEKSRSTYTLTIQGFTYENEEMLYRLNWSLLLPFYIYQDTILLSGRDNGTILFMIGKLEVGDELFKNIHEFLQGNIGFTGYKDTKKIRRL